MIGSWMKGILKCIPFAVDMLLNAALNFVEQNCCVSGVNCGGKEKVDGGVRDMVGRQEQQNN